MNLHEILAMTAAFAVIMISGAAVFRLLAREQAVETPVTERWGLCWLLGTSYVSIATFLAGFFIKGTPLIALITCGGFLLFAMGRRWSRVPRQKGPAFSVLEWLVVALFVAQVFFMMWRASQVALGWDGMVLWEAKARVAAQNGGVIPFRYFSEPPFGWAQQRYPLYLPYTESFFYMWLGRADQSWVRALGPLMYASGVLILIGAAQRLGAPRFGALFCGAMFFFVPHCFTSRWNVLEGYADFPLGLFVLASVSRLPALARSPLSLADVRLFAVLSGMIVWVKQEGQYLWFIVAGIAALQLVLLGRSKVALRVVIPGAVIGVGFMIFLKLLATPADPYYHPPTFRNLARFSDRIGPVFEYLGWELVNSDNWSLLWVGFLVGCCFMMARPRTRRAGILIGSVIVSALFLFVWPFVFSNLESYRNHLDHALSRLMFQLAPTAMLVIAVALPYRQNQQPLERAETRA